MSMWLISDHACAQEVKGKGYVMCCIHAYIVDIHVHTMWLFYHPEIWLFCMWSILMIHLCLQACSKVVPTLQESLLIYNLVTTLLQPWNRLAGMTNPGFGQCSGKVVTTWSQLCTNHATTLFQTYHYLVARLLQGWYKLATSLVPRPCPAFCRLQYRKAVEDLEYFIMWVT